MAREITKYTYLSYSNVLENDDDENDNLETKSKKKLNLSDSFKFKKKFNSSFERSVQVRNNCKVDINDVKVEKKNYIETIHNLDIANKTTNGHCVRDWTTEKNNVSEGLENTVANNVNCSSKNADVISGAHNNHIFFNEKFNTNSKEAFEVKIGYEKKLKTEKLNPNKTDFREGGIKNDKKNLNIPQTENFTNCNSVEKLNSNDFSEKENSACFHCYEEEAHCSQNQLVNNYILTQNSQSNETCSSKLNKVNNITPICKNQQKQESMQNFKSIQFHTQPHDNCASQYSSYLSPNGLIFAGSILLMEAISQNRSDLVDYLISNHQELSLDLNSRDKTGSNVLFYATSVGSVSDVDKLVVAGCQVVSDYENRTVLMQAALSDRIDTAKYLVTCAPHIGLDIHQIDLSGKNALFYAVESNSTRMLEYLMIKANLQANTITLDDNSTLLMLAAATGNEKMIHFLIQEYKRKMKYFQPHWEGFNGYLPNGNIVDCNSIGDSNQSNQHIKSDKLSYDSNTNNNNNTINYYDINFENSKGENVLFYGVQSNNPNVVKILVENGANPLKKNKNGMNVVSYAMNNSSPEIVCVILKASKSSSLINTKNSNNEKKVSFNNVDMYEKETCFFDNCRDHPNFKEGGFLKNNDVISKTTCDFKKDSFCCNENKKMKFVLPLENTTNADISKDGTSLAFQNNYVDASKNIRETINGRTKTPITQSQHCFCAECLQKCAEDEIDGLLVDEATYENEKALNDSGYNMEEDKTDRNSSCDTKNEKENDKNKVNQSGHIFLVIEKSVEDYDSNKNRRIINGNIDKSSMYPVGEENQVFKNDSVINSSRKLIKNDKEHVYSCTNIEQKNLNKKTKKNTKTSVSHDSPKSAFAASCGNKTECHHKNNKVHLEEKTNEINLVNKEIDIVNDAKSNEINDKKINNSHRQNDEKESNKENNNTIKPNKNNLFENKSDFKIKTSRNKNNTFQQNITSKINDNDIKRQKDVIEHIESARMNILSDKSIYISDPFNYKSTFKKDNIKNDNICFDSDDNTNGSSSGISSRSSNNSICELYNKDEFSRNNSSFENYANKKNIKERNVEARNDKDINKNNNLEIDSNCINVKKGIIRNEKNHKDANMKTNEKSINKSNNILENISSENNMSNQRGHNEVGQIYATAINSSAIFNKDEDVNFNGNNEEGIISNKNLKNNNNSNGNMSTKTCVDACTNNKTRYYNPPSIENLNKNGQVKEANHGKVFTFINEKNNNKIIKSVSENNIQTYKSKNIRNNYDKNSKLCESISHSTKDEPKHFAHQNDFHNVVGAQKNSSKEVNKNSHFYKHPEFIDSGEISNDEDLKLKDINLCTINELQHKHIPLKSENTRCYLKENHFEKQIENQKNSSCQNNALKKQDIKLENNKKHLNYNYLNNSIKQADYDSREYYEEQLFQSRDNKSRELIQYLIEVGEDELALQHLKVIISNCEHSLKYKVSLQNEEKNISTKSKNSKIQENYTSEQIETSVNTSNSCLENKKQNSRDGNIETCYNSINKNGSDQNKAHSLFDLSHSNASSIFPFDQVIPKSPSLSNKENHVQNNNLNCSNYEDSSNDEKENLSSYRKNTKININKLDKPSMKIIKNIDKNYIVHEEKKNEKLKVTNVEKKSQNSIKTLSNETENKNNLDISNSIDGIKQNNLKFSLNYIEDNHNSQLSKNIERLDKLKLLRDETGCNLLMSACKQPLKDSINIFQKNNNSTKNTEKDSRSTNSDCVRNDTNEASIKRLELVKFLCEVLKIDPEETNKQKRTALFFAVESGNLAITSYLLRKSKRICSDNNGKSILMVAVATGNQLTVSEILASRFSSELLPLKDNTGKTVLHYSAMQDASVHNSLVLDTLLRFEENLFRDKSPLHKSKRNTKYDPDEADNEGKTALMMACQAGNKSAVMRLLNEAAVLTDRKDLKGRTALHYCFFGNQTSLACVSCLLMRGLDPNHSDDEGKTPLMLACNACAVTNIPVIRKLTDFGANPVVQDNDGNDSFNYLPVYNSDYVKAILKEKSGISDHERSCLDAMEAEMREHLNLNSVLRGLTKHRITTKTLNFEVMKQPVPLRISKLIEVLSHRGKSSYRTFCQVLKEQRHHFIAYQLLRAAYITQKEYYF